MERAWAFFNSSGSESVESAIHMAILYWQHLRPPVEDRADLPLPELPRLDARAPSGCPARRGARPSSSCWRRTRSRRRRTPTSAPGARPSRRSSSRSPRSRTRSRRAAPTTSPPSSSSRSPGASAAAVVPPDGYLERRARGVRPLRGADDLRRDHHGASGAPAPGSASQHWDFSPDIVTFAKGVTSGHAALLRHGGGGPCRRRLHAPRPTASRGATRSRATRSGAPWPREADPR